MTLDEARRRLRSADHHRAKQQFIQIARACGAEPIRVLDAIGDWHTGTENSVVLEFGPVPWPRLRMMAARMGLEYRQEGVALFSAMNEGRHAQWKARFHQPIEAIREALHQAGSESHTLVETKEHVGVILCDDLEPMRAKIAAIVEALGDAIESIVVPGQFQVITGKSRADAARVFRSIIAQGGREVEHMAAEKEKPWFLLDLSGRSDKIKALAAIARRCWEVDQLPPEEARRRSQKALEGFRQMGCTVYDPRDLAQGPASSIIVPGDSSAEP